MFAAVEGFHVRNLHHHAVLRKRLMDGLGIATATRNFGACELFIDLGSYDSILKNFSNRSVAVKVGISVFTNEFIDDSSTLHRLRSIRDANASKTHPLDSNWLNNSFQQILFGATYIVCLKRSSTNRDTEDGIIQRDEIHTSDIHLR